LPLLKVISQERAGESFPTGGTILNAFPTEVGISGGQEVFSGEKKTLARGEDLQEKHQKGKKKD